MIPVSKRPDILVSCIDKNYRAGWFQSEREIRETRYLQYTINCTGQHTSQQWLKDTLCHPAPREVRKKEGGRRKCKMSVRMGGTVYTSIYLLTSTRHRLYFKRGKLSSPTESGLPSSCPQHQGNSTFPPLCTCLVHLHAQDG